MRYARKIDDNQEDVVKALRLAGVWVHSVANAGSGFPDLLCWHPRTGYHLLEVKDGAKVPSAQRLTPAQEKFHRQCPAPIHVVRSGAEAVHAVLGGAHE